MPSVIYRDPKIKINAVVYKDTTVRVKKLKVGTPVRRVTAGSFDITNLGGVDPAGKTAGSILAYNASTTKWSTTNFATGNNISIAFDSAANTFTFGTNAALTDVTSLDATTTSTVRGVLSASGDLAYNSSTGQFSIDVENVYTKANFDSDLGLANTGQLPEGSNLYYTTSRADSDFDTRLATKNTGNLSEGSNLYYTDARSRGSISVTDAGGDGSLAYNNSTGVVTYTGPSASEARAHVSAVDAGGDGSFTYNSGTGAFTYTGPSAAEVRAHITANKGLSISSGELNIDSANVKGMFSGGTGVTYNNGVISIGQPVATTSNVTFNDVIISGDLTVSGTQTTVNTETILLADNVIVVNSNATGSPTENGGIEVERGDDANKTLIWNETDDKWTVGSETFVAERFEGDVDGALLVDVYNNTGSTLSKGDAVYLTGSNNGDNPHVALADADDASKMPALGIVKNNIGNNSVGQVATSGVINDASHGYTLGSDLYISSTAGQLTTTKPTGEANLIQKIGKVVSSNHIIVQGAFRTNQTPNLNDGKIFIGNGSNQSVTSTLDTSIVPENSNLYHTTARARGAVSAGGDLSYNSSTGVFSIDVEDAYTKVNFDSDLSAANTGQLPEGSNLYYTSARSDSDAKNAISVTDAGGDGSLSYNTSTGVITYTGASAAEVRAHLTANKGLSVTDGEFNIDSANVRGMFSASGDLSYNSGTGQFSFDVENVYTKANFDSDLGLANTGQLPEGSNLYYTDSRADARITAALIDEDDMTSNSATRLPSQQSVKAYVDSQVQSKDALSELSGTTDDVTEGSTNLYHTDARVDARITTASVTATGALMDSELTDLAGVKGVTISTLQPKPSEGAFVDGDKTKLDGIEASADVTDTANVTSAGALMDSELTDLAGVKGVTISTLQPKPSEGAFVDGDKTKLDAIESGATADQTDAEIKTAYENNSDTNAFTDAEKTKLTNIEASADVTDTANVTSAGALMDSELTDLAGVKGVTISTLQVKPTEGAFVDGDKTKLDAIEASADVTDTANVTAAGALMDSELTDLAGVKGVTISTLQVKPTEGAFVDGDKTKLDGIEASADVTDTANVTSAGALMDSELVSIADVKALDQSVVSGASPTFTTTNFTDDTDKRFMTDAQESKLDGIEASATADQTDAEIRAAVEAATDSNVFTDADHSKLNAIEASADVTDTANVTAAGALMDSEVDADIKTLSLPANTTISAFGKTLVDDADAATARTTLGVDASGTDNSTDVTLAGSLDYITISGQEITRNAIDLSTDVTGTLPVGNMAATALTTVQTAANESAHLALTAQEGDVVVRSDQNKTYMHNGGTAGTMDDYTLLATPTDAVTSVNGNTGVVTVTENVTTNLSITGTDAARTIVSSDGTDAVIPVATDSVSGVMSAADHTKLTGIETSADVTDTANVTAAGALMDSELASIADVKALDQSVISGASPTFGTANMSDATNKRFMTDAQETKLDSVESSADVTDTANVTAAGALMDSELTDLAGVKGVTISTLQVKPSEGAFANGDKTKLDGIEASADVTDTANVTAAGALMDSELTDLAGVKGVTISTLQVKPSEGAFVDGDKTKLDAIEASADVTDTANVTAAGALMDSELTDLAGVKGVTISTLQPKPSEGAFANGDKTKLDGIEASADVTDTANVTSAGALMDSELTSIADVKALDQSVVSGASPNFATTNMTDASNKRFMSDAQESKLDGIEASATADQTAAEILTAVKTVDGASSGLDADLLDGVEGASYLRSDADDTFTGNLTVAGTLQVEGATGETIRLHRDDTTVTGGNLIGQIAFSHDDDTNSGDGVLIKGIANGATGNSTLQIHTGTPGSLTEKIRITDSGINVTGAITGDALTVDTTASNGVTINAHDNVTTTYPLKVSNAAGSGNLELGTYGINNNIDLKLQRGGSTKLTVTSSGVDVTGITKTAGTGYNPTNTGWATNAALITTGSYGGGLTFVDGSAGYSIRVENSGADFVIGQGATSGALTQKVKITSSGVDVTGTVEFDGLSGTGAVTVTDILDQDDMSSNSATALATQQSIKAYVDANAGGGSATTDASELTSGILPAARVAHNTFDIGDTTAETGRSVHETGLYTFNVNNNNLGTGTDTSYYSVLSYGQGTGGSAQIATKWVTGDKIYFRSLRDTTDDWFDWKEIWHEDNDGSGSGLDADLLDGVQGASYLRSDADDEVNAYTTQITFPSNTNAATASGDQSSLQVKQATANSDAFMTFHVNTDFAVYFGLDGTTNDLFVGGWSMGANKYKIWHQNNDGSGSGLDADTLDGVQGADYLRAKTRTTWNTSPAVIGNVVGELAWKNYGNNHTIFDASAGTNPGGGSINNTDPNVAWSASYPTLMGWNGTNTYGVRVDRAKQADNLDGIDSTQFLRSDTDDTFTGTLTMAGQLQMNGNIINDVEDIYLRDKMYHDADTDTYMGYAANTVNFVTGGTNRLQIDDSQVTASGEFQALRLRVTSTGDASNSSTTHGIQVGSTSSTNIRIDGNEILAVDNGANAQLNLQVEGGTTNFGGELQIPNKIIHSGDTDTYIQFHAANEFRVVVAGNERFEVTSTNVTIPVDMTIADQIIHQGDTNTYIQFHAADQFRVVTGGVERFEVNNSQVTVQGVLGVNTAIDLADNKILRFGTGDDVEFFFDGADMYTDLNAGSWFVRDGTTNRFLLQDGGNFHADANIFAYSTSVGSDRKLKDNIEVIESPLEKIQKLNGVTFNWKRDGEASAGVIAQDVQKVLPSAVKEVPELNGEGEDATRLNVDYNQIIGLLVESVKELKKEIEELKKGK